jgi:hypothetical protein
MERSSTQGMGRRLVSISIGTATVIPSDLTRSNDEKTNVVASRCLRTFDRLHSSAGQ